MGKKAVLIGCNYPGTNAELKGCINDVMRMRGCLLDRYAFSSQDITLLVDTDASYTPPTGKNIRQALSRLVGSAKPGDFLFVHYSGHGVRLPAESGDDDDTGYDECIVPCDMNLITDDDFREFVDRVPRGCLITLVSDSCHSGGLIDDSKEQIGQSTRKEHGSRSAGFKGFLRHSEARSTEKGHLNIKNRSLPLSTLIDVLRQKTGKDDIEVGKLRPALFDIFGEDATPKVKKFMQMITNKLQQGDSGGLLGMVGNLAQEFLKQKLDEKGEGYTKPAMGTNIGSKREAHAGSRGKELPDGGILISGCQTDETSADASPTDGTGLAYGALSNAIQTIIAHSQEKLTNQQLVLKAREMLQTQGFSQRPGLYCSDCHVDAPFLCHS